MESNPWDIQPGEPQNWHSRFTRFRLLGASRSLLATVNSERAEKGQQRTNDSPGAWRRAAKRWNWLERAKVWDRMQDQQNERVWEERRRQLLEREWAMSRALHDKAAEMLAVKLKEARWSVRDVAAFFEISSNLARRSTGLEGDSMIKQQLNLAYELMRKLLTIEDSASASEIKGLVYAHLESVLLQIGRPIKEVTSVLSETEAETDFETDFEIDESDR